VGKKKVIALTIILILIVAGYYVYSTGLLLRWLLTTPVGVWLLVNTPLGIIVRLLYPPPQPPKLTPEPWWNWTYQAPVQASLAEQESLADKIIVESISLVKVANNARIYTGRVYTIPLELLNNESEHMAPVGIYDGRRAVIWSGSENKSLCFDLSKINESIIVSESLRARVSYKLSAYRHEVWVNLPIPQNPQGGSSPLVFMKISEKSIPLNNTIIRYVVGKNLYINYLPSEWFTLDVKYLDVWTGFEDLRGWRLDNEMAVGATVISDPNNPVESFTFALGLDTSIYEPACLLAISIKNGLDAPIIAITVTVGEETINIPLNFPLKPGESISAELGLMRAFAEGETCKVTLRTYYVDRKDQAIAYVDKDITVQVRR